MRIAGNTSASPSTFLAAPSPGDRFAEKLVAANMSSPWPGSRRAFGRVGARAAEKRRRRKARREDRERGTGRGTGRRTGLSPDRGYKWAKQRSVRMPRARLQVAWPPINMSAGNTMPRHTTPLSHPPSPSGSPSPPPPRRIYISLFPTAHSFSPLFHPRRAFEYYGNVDARSPPRDPERPASVIHPNEQPGVGWLVGWLNTSACAFSTCRNRWTLGSFSLGALLGRGAAGDDSFLFFFSFFLSLFFFLS